MRCEIQEVNGFLKNVCGIPTSYGSFSLKCYNSEQYYEGPVRLFGPVCSNDPFYYQACGLGGLATNSEFLCEYYLCEKDGGYLTSNFLKQMGWICNNITDCKKTGQDEAQCSEMITLRSGRRVFSGVVCDDVCDTDTCEDEANCDGYTYGVYCKVSTDGIVNMNHYIAVKYVCDGIIHCDDGEDEADCTVTDDTTYSCHKYGKLVPVHDFIRCKPLGLQIPSSYDCVEHFSAEQTNCADPSKVGGTCKVGGNLSTISKYMLCHLHYHIENEGGKYLCDDGIENQCFAVSNLCFLHKHHICDEVEDCADGKDEGETCREMTEKTCRRRIGREVELPIPLMWLKDGVQDCMDGGDEADIWPTCGEGRTLRYVFSTETCKNVFVCRWGNTGFSELEHLCDGVDVCGNENQICSVFRRTFRGIQTTVPTTEKGLVKRLSFCLDGLGSIAQLANITCLSKSFIYPNHDYFGVDTRTTVWLPNSTQHCDHMFGEQYLYTSCNGMCNNSSCPLTRHIRYEVCPRQYRNRVGTIAEHSYLAFFTRSHGDVYTNRYFVCANKVKCIDYSQVCNLADDCGDGSDELNCTNHFQCTFSGDFIPKIKMCDDKIDCLDMTDECNEHCANEILKGSSLKGLSWTIGSLSVLANLIIVLKNVGTLAKSRTSVAMINKSLIILISVGDMLVGSYLFVIAIYDGIVFKRGYCFEEITWKTSFTCSLIGAFSTIGSQISLFSMAGLSVVRLRGIMNTMRIPGEVTVRKSVQIFMGIMAIVVLSVAVAAIPIVTRFEDFFVNGVKFEDQLRIFIGTPDKRQIFAAIEAYHGRMKDASLSWNMTIKMVQDMFSHNPEYEDHTQVVNKVGFYGNDGVCLFKYFVKDSDPQRNFVWSILAINFVCFFFISISYLLIGITSYKSSKGLSNSQKNQQISQRNRKMNQKIAIIICTDFLCWMPFIVICILHSIEALDATPWYGFFSMIILPINSVINPFLYDDSLTKPIIESYSKLSSRFSRFYRAPPSRSIQPETIELAQIST